VNAGAVGRASGKRSNASAVEGIAEDLGGPRGRAAESNPVHRRNRAADRSAQSEGVGLNGGDAAHVGELDHRRAALQEANVLVDCVADDADAGIGANRVDVFRRDGVPAAIGERVARDGGAGVSAANVDGRARVAGVGRREGSREGIVANHRAGGIEKRNAITVAESVAVNVETAGRGRLDNIDASVVVIPGEFVILDIGVGQPAVRVDSVAAPRACDIVVLN